MSVEKLSVSMESSLVKLIRGAAADEGTSISTWLADAATAKARQRVLREALQHDAEEHGALDAAEVERLVSAARKHSIVSRPRKRR
jgi:uncharacterized protein (DUF1778 family)